MRFALIILLLSTINSLSAQVAVGPTIGANFSYISNSPFDQSIHPGFQIGASFNYSFHPRISLSQNILFVQKGIKFKNIRGDRREDIYCVGVDFLPRGYYISKEKLKAFLSAGPALHFLLFGYEKTEKGSEDDVNGSIDFDENSISVDLGFYFATGVQIEKAVIELRYGLWLKDYERYGNQHDNQSFRIAEVSFAYLFDL